MTYLDNYISGSISVAEDFDVRLDYHDAIALADGRFAVFWDEGQNQSPWGFRIFEADGTAVTDETLGYTSDDNIFLASVTDVSALPDGGFLVTWIEAFNNKAFYLSQYDADGQLVDFVENFVSTNVFTNDFLRVSEGNLETSVSASGAVLNAVEHAYWKVPLSLIDPIPDDALSGFLTFPGGRPGPLGPVEFADAFTELGANYSSQMDLAFVTDHVAVATWQVTNDFLQPEGVYGQLLFANGTEASAPFSIFIDDRIEGSVTLTALKDDRFVVFFYDGDDDDLGSFQIFDVVPDGDDAWQAVAVGDRILAEEFRPISARHVSPTNDGGFVVAGAGGVRRFDANGAEIAFDAELFSDRNVLASELFIEDILQLSTGEFVSFVNYPIPNNPGDPSYIAAVIFDAEAEEIVGTTGANTLVGTALGETLSGLAGNDTLDAGAGNDTLLGGDGADILLGRAGQDLLRGNDGNDRLFGGSDNDILSGNNGADELAGGSGDDRLFGGNGNDRLDGGNGADDLEGGDGRDILLGRAGEDTLRGGDDNDRLYGGADNDLLSGNNGVDQLYGGSGNDRLFGGNGNDRLIGDNGNDELGGGNGEDLLLGRDGNDLIRGNDDNDRLFGNDGNDTLSGGRNDDQLVGGTGDDRMFGGSGVDTLEGGRGADFMDGGSGADTFVFEANDSGTTSATRDEIRGFSSGVDMIDLSGVFDGTLVFVDSYTGAAGEVRYREDIGRLYVQIDGKGGSDFSIDFAGDPALSESDLIL